MVSSLFVGRGVLDSTRMTPRQRAVVGLVLIGVFNLLQWIYAAWVQLSWTEFYNYQEKTWVYVWDKDNRPSDLTGPSLNSSCVPAIHSTGNVCIDGQLYG